MFSWRTFWNDEVTSPTSHVKFVSLDEINCFGLRYAIWAVFTMKCTMLLYTWYTYYWCWSRLHYLSWSTDVLFHCHFTYYGWIKISFGLGDDPKSISGSATRWRQYAYECSVILARLKEQSGRSLTSDGADSPWSQHCVAATSTDRTALISFSGSLADRWSIPFARSTVWGWPAPRHAPASPT